MRQQPTQTAVDRSGEGYKEKQSLQQKVQEAPAQTTGTESGGHRICRQGVETHKAKDDQPGEKGKGRECGRHCRSKGTCMLHMGHDE